MGNATGVFKKRASDDHKPKAVIFKKAGAKADDDEDESTTDEEDNGQGQDDNLMKFITTAADLKQKRKQHKGPEQAGHGVHTPYQYHRREKVVSAPPTLAGDVQDYPSSVLTPVGEEEAPEAHKHKKTHKHKRLSWKRALRKCCCPCLWILGKIWDFLQYINRLAAFPVGHPENLLNGCIFAAVVAIMQHMLQVMFPISNDPVLREMYCCPNQITQKFEIIMVLCNSLVVIAAYSIIWQTCGPFLFLSPVYMVFLIYSMLARHISAIIIKPDTPTQYSIYRTIEQAFRLLYIMWEFCVVMAYTRQTRADRAARDTYLKARRRRLDFISKTRRHEDRKQFLRDPVRQKTVLLLTDPKRPWLKQTMAAKLAEQAFSQNEALSALWGPVRRSRTSQDMEIPTDSDAGSGSDKGGGGGSKTQANQATHSTEKKKWLFGLF